MLKFLRKELIALFGEIGATLTVLGQLASEIPMPDWLREFLLFWRQFLTAIWQPLFANFDWVQHPQLIAALSLAVFMCVLGIGARIAKGASRRPLAPLEARFLEDMSIFSLLVYAGLVYAFLIGSGPDPAAEPPITMFGSEIAGRYTFALLVTAGYALGDFFGHKSFHRRLMRLAVVVIAVVAGLTFAMQPTAA
ncbi:MAG: hypothetical protein K0U34_04610 [Alphaproteobacteria bacterium]|nr:hypothetical protein [Alphaproteobacteria bacterium]